MTKQQAIQTFGSVAKLAAALGCSPQAIYYWPDVLTLRIADRVRGAMVRLGKYKPDEDQAA